MPAKATGRFDVVGTRELQQALLMLPKSMRRTPLGNALKKAGEPTRALAAANAPYDPTDNWGGKHLRDSIRVTPKLKRSQRRGRGRLVDGVEVFVGSSSPLAHLVEFGTAERFRKSATGTGATGRMPANPFLTRAWDATRDGALAILKTELWAEVRAAAKRIRKRAIKGTLSIKVQREILHL